MLTHDVAFAGKLYAVIDVVLTVLSVALPVCLHAHAGINAIGIPPCDCSLCLQHRD